MSVTLSPIAPRYAVSDADDPFKKYWWAILAGFAFTGLWLLMPMMGEKAVGSVSIDTSRPKADPNVEQSMAPADTGNGINLSMEGTGHQRKEDGALSSSLFLAPDETPAAGAAGLGTATAGSSAAGSTSLASALKKVSEKSDGGWGEKAQKAFNAPKLGGPSLSGMGAASGGSAGASGGSSAFGAHSANVGYGATKGLSGDAKDLKAPEARGGLSVLKAASDQALAAARNTSNDGARGAMSQAFDGAKAGSKISNGGAALAGSYAGLDAAPANLKDGEPKGNAKKVTPPPSTDMGDSKYTGNDAELGKQLAMQVMGGVVGGLIGGPIGGIVTNAVMSALQKQMDQQDKVHELEAKQQMDQAKRATGGKLESSGP